MGKVTLIDRDERAKGEDSGQGKEKQTECSRENDHTLIHCVTWVSREETESSSLAL